MLDTLTGFTVVALAILVGYIVGRIDLLGEHARPVLAKLNFYVLAPFLLFVVIAGADVRMLFSALLPVSAVAALSVMVLFIAVARLFWKRSPAETLIGALSAGQVNSNNIGIPLSLYVLGNAAYSAPVILMQVLIFIPITLALLGSFTSEKTSIWRILGRTALNPMVIGSAAGILVAVSGLELPPIVMEPFVLIANACVPILLISYGISLHGQRVLGRHGRRRDVLLASALKLFAMPLIAWLVAQFMFGMPPHEVLIVVVLAALPTAQNIFNFAQRYEVAEPIARDTIFVTTLGCVPVILLAALVLG